MKASRPELLLLAVLLTGVAPCANAIEPIPEAAGWRGFEVLGAGYTDLESNLVAGNRFIDIGRPASAVGPRAGLGLPGDVFLARHLH